MINSIFYMVLASLGPIYSFLLNQWAKSAFFPNYDCKIIDVWHAEYPDLSEICPDLGLCDVEHI